MGTDQGFLSARDHHQVTGGEIWDNGKCHDCAAASFEEENKREDRQLGIEKKYGSGWPGPGRIEHAERYKEEFIEK